jgi:hypothetical protein
VTLIPVPICRRASPVQSDSHKAAVLMQTAPKLKPVPARRHRFVSISGVFVAPNTLQSKQEANRVS